MTVNQQRENVVKGFGPLPNIQREVTSFLSNGLVKGLDFKGFSEIKRVKNDPSQGKFCRMALHFK